MKPRHADLLATDLDDGRYPYIDASSCSTSARGDRLQRTSVWLENLEGGIDYCARWSAKTRSASAPS